MIYKGRELDVLSLWSEFVTLPNVGSSVPTFLPKVTCPNPDHDTRKQHFQINTLKPMVHCFGRCGISGSYEHAVSVLLGFYAKYGVTLDEALEVKDTPFKRNESAKLTQNRLKCAKAHKDARRFILKGHTRVATKSDVASAYAGRGIRKTVSTEDPVAMDERDLMSGKYQYLSKEARAYLDFRGIEPESRGRWRIGWSEEEERIIIPAYDHRGVFRFLIKRAIHTGGSLKYLYTPGAIKSSILFGAHMLDMDRVHSDGLVLVEGSIDTVYQHQIGGSNTVGTLGSGLSMAQVKLIAKMNPRRVYLFFDKDSAGMDNIADARAKLRKVPVFVVRYPKHRNDPGEGWTREEVERQLRRALPIHEFYRKARNLGGTRRKVTI
jgi:hypothetical protein